MLAGSQWRYGLQSMGAQSQGIWARVPATSYRNGQGTIGLCQSLAVERLAAYGVVMLCSESVSGNRQSVTDASLSSDGSRVLSESFGANCPR